MECSEVRDRIVLLVDDPGRGGREGDGDGLGAEERARLERHVAGCAACGAELAAERRLRDLLAGHPAPEPGAVLLTRCREDLGAALARLETGGDVDRGPGGRVPDRRVSSGRWSGLRTSPALAAATAVAGAFLAGYLAGRPAAAPSAGSREALGDPAAVAAALDSLEVDRATGRVRLTYNAVSREAIEGELSDPAIRRLLAEAVRSSPNAGLRLDAIEGLRGGAAAPEVRAALLRAVREDDNAGARLRAIDVLRSRAPADAEVQRVIVEALVRDRNPGVRVGAIDLLASAPQAPAALPLLERAARQDDNRYVRLRSAAVVEAAFHGEER